MRVIDAINAASPEGVEAVYRSAYQGEVEAHGDKTWADSDTFRKLKDMVNAAVGIQSDMIVMLKEVVEGNNTYIDVSGHTPDSESNWAIELQPWGEWKLCPVEYPDGMSIDEVACHLFYEMTWFGWPEQAEEQLAKLQDAVESIKREL